MKILHQAWATLGHSWVTLGRFRGKLGPILGRLGALLGHLWGTSGALWADWSGLGRVLVGIRVNGDLDPVGIVLFRNDRRGKVVLLPVPIEIGKACAGAFADVDERKDVEDVRITGVAVAQGLTRDDNAITSFRACFIPNVIRTDVDITRPCEITKRHMCLRKKFWIHQRLIVARPKIRRTVKYGNASALECHFDEVVINCPCLFQCLKVLHI